MWCWAGSAGDRVEVESRAAAGRRGRWVTCCFVSSAPVPSALPQGGRPGEPNQCWIWRWCPSALWEMSNGNSRWVSMGSSLTTLLADPSFLPSFLALPTFGLCSLLPCARGPRLFGAPATGCPLRPPRPGSVPLCQALTPLHQASAGPLLGQCFSNNNNNNGWHAPNIDSGPGPILLCIIISSMPPGSLLFVISIPILKTK